MTSEIVLPGMRMRVDLPNTLPWKQTWFCIMYNEPSIFFFLSVHAYSCTITSSGSLNFCNTAWCLRFVASRACGTRIGVPQCGLLTGLAIIIVRFCSAVASGWSTNRCARVSVTKWKKRRERSGLARSVGVMLW